MPDTGVLLTAGQKQKLSDMAKKKQPQADDSDPKPKPISYRPSPAVEAGLEAFRNRFEFLPDKSAVIERALRDFLRAQGVRLTDEAK